ncbi:MAG: hypothetical protein A3C47_01060 [Omnitrophica bacterium RIFCSPHIGHO2_02_FULL_51_18]|nr:MAG: hypothetical protein A3C47_01060 [Omnitrophica bacterium RIFCSPHIGHO2_02_FULL_51_18]
MKKGLILSLAFFLLSRTAGAEPKNIVEISDASISQIDALHTKAEGQIVENDFRGAVRTYEDILLVEPDDEAAYTNLGRIYMILGDTQKAAECFQNALHINPDNEGALFGIEKIRDPDKEFVESASPQT